MSLLRHGLLLSILLASPAAAQNLDSLLARMTLEEKLGQLNLLSAGGRASPAQMPITLNRPPSWPSRASCTGATAAHPPVAPPLPRRKRLPVPGAAGARGYRAPLPR